jgi:protease-4
MSKTTKWVIGIIGGVFVLFFVLFVAAVISLISSGEGGETTETTTSGSGEGKVAVVDLREPIISSEDIVRQFKRYRENSSIRAIIFRVESPGGGVAASQEIYEEVRKTRDAGKPVVVSMGAIAASGGYYVSCGASKIVANPGTLTGSIGVIIQYLQFKDLMNKIGVGETTIKTGKFKDSGSPFRKMTEEERRYFTTVVDDVYDQFVDVVASERKLDRKKVLKYADGRIFTGRQALQYGFVDTLGTMEDAVKIAAVMAGIHGKPSVVREIKRKPLFERLFGDAASELTSVKEQLLHQPVLQYRFTAPY